jgi:hypothetical protein
MASNEILNTYKETIMPNEPIPGSVILTHDNVERIIEVAAKRGFTIGHLRDSIEYHAEEDGAETILFTSVYPWIQQISNFNDVPYDPSYEYGVPLMSTEEFLALLESTPEIS